MIEVKEDELIRCPICEAVNIDKGKEMSVVVADLLFINIELFKQRRVGRILLRLSLLIFLQTFTLCSLPNSLELQRGVLFSEALLCYGNMVPIL